LLYVASTGASLLPELILCGVVTMNRAEAMEGGVDAKLAANRFVTGALRRIRIRTRLNELAWLEGSVAMASRSHAREMEEMVPTGD